MSKDDGLPDLLPPPRLRPHPELHPVAEFSFDDQPAPEPEVQYNEWERIDSTPIEDEPVLTDELARAAKSVATSNQRASELLGDRYVAIGTSLRQKRREDDEPTLVFVAYDYDDDRTVEVVIELDGDDLSVVDVETANYQPAPVAEELDRAIELAAEDEWLDERLSRELEGSAILVTPEVEDEPHGGHRLFDVRFGRPNERLPEYRALVDLSAGTVVETGVVGDRGEECGCHGRKERTTDG